MIPVVMGTVTAKAATTGTSFSVPWPCQSSSCKPVSEPHDRENVGVVGVTYSGTAKQAEHGGFAHDDTNVMLLLSNPGFKAQTVYATVGTAQVAPTVLKALHIDPTLLDAVRLEGTGVLPAVQFP